MVVSIDNSGDIEDEIIGEIEFNDSRGYEPSIINAFDNFLIIAYRGPGNDGFVTVVSIDVGSNGSTYEILSSAGGMTVRSYVNTSGDNATILSWIVQ